MHPFLPPQQVGQTKKVMLGTWSQTVPAGLHLCGETGIAMAPVQSKSNPASQPEGCDTAGIPGHVDGAGHLASLQQTQVIELEHQRGGGESQSHQQQ